MAGYKTVIYLFLLLFFSTIAAVSQTVNQPDFKFRTYNTLDGLADNSVVKIVQDKKGFLWMATHNGLSQFDGLTFKNYTYIPNDTNSLRSIWITDMVLDNKGTLWITTEWGVCWYDEKFDCFHYINSPQQIQILYKAPICVGADNNIWLAAEDGLKKINTAKKTFEKTALNRIPDPQSIATDSQGKIWVGTRGNGFFVYDPKLGKASHFFAECVPAKVHIMDMLKEGNFIWAATSDGLLKINSITKDIRVNGRPENKTFINDNALMSVTTFPAFTGDTMLLCGTYDKRLLLFNKKKKEFVYQWQNTHTKLNDMPHGIYFDLLATDNILWVGSDHGLSNLNLKQQDFTASTIPLFYNKGQNKTLIKNLVADKWQPTNYWLNSAKPDSGIYIYNHVDGGLKKISNSYYNWLLLNDSTGDVWACKKRGIDIYDRAGLQKKIDLPVTPTSGCFNDKSQLWLATETGLATINTYTKEYKIFNSVFKGEEVENQSFEESFSASDIANGKDGKIWVTSIKYGLFEFDIKSEKFKPHRQPFTTAYEAKNRCSALTIDGNGNIWVSTMAGLTMYKPTEDKFINYDHDSGLINTYVYSIKLLNDSILWGRGNTGIFSFNINSHQLSDYSLPQEMVPSFFEQRISKIGNNILVGFEGGYASFNPPVLQAPNLYTVHITSCIVLGKRYAYDFDNEEKTVPIFNHAENVISLAFTAIDYEQPEKINYAYKLEGFDKDWQISGKRNTAFYTNLPPGHYTFIAKARRDNGEWTATSERFSFYIKPAIWQRFWFLPSIILLIVATVFFLAIKRVKDIQQEHTQKANISKMMTELEMKTLRSQMNPHFIFNSLNSVQKFIWENKKDDASDYLSKFARLIRMILEYSSQTSISLNQELAALKTYIELEHRRSNGRFEYSLQVEEDIDGAHVQVPPLLLQPFVENAIWHGLGPLQERGGTLNINISRTKDWLVCIIKDNGIGRTKAAELKAQSSIPRKSVGMEITRQRIHLLEKDGSKSVTVEVTDLIKHEQAAGTQVMISIPVVFDTVEG